MHWFITQPPNQIALNADMNEGSVLQTVVIKTCILLSENKKAASRSTGPDKHGYNKAVGQMLPTVSKKREQILWSRPAQEQLKETATKTQKASTSRTHGAWYNE